MAGIDLEEMASVQSQLCRTNPDINFIFERPKLSLRLRRGFYLLHHGLKCGLFGQHLFKQVLKLWIEQQECVLAFPRIQRAYDLLKPHVPHHEEEPVAHNEASLALEHTFALQVRGDVGDGPPMGAVLLQVFDEEDVLHPLDKVQQVVEYVRV